MDFLEERKRKLTNKNTTKIKPMNTKKYSIKCPVIREYTVKLVVTGRWHSTRKVDSIEPVMGYFGAKWEIEPERQPFLFN